MGTNDLAGDDPAGQTGWARRGQALSLTFDVESQTVLPGGTLAFPFRLHNEASASVTYQFRLEVEDPLHLDDWSVRGPTVLGAGEMAQATLSVHVPSSGAEPGAYRLRLLAVTPGQAGAVGGDCVVVVEGRPCVLFPSSPKIHLNPDGSFSLSLNILDCGDV